MSSTKAMSQRGTRLIHSLLALMLVLSFVAGLPVQPVWATEGSEDSTVFAVVTDYGYVGSTVAATVANMVNDWEPDFIVTAGDNNQGSTCNESCYQGVSGAYYGPEAESSGRTDYMTAGKFWPVPGNHDYSSPIASYAAYFNYLPHVDHAGTALFYEFVEGPVHFFMMDSGSWNGAAPDLTTQKNWLQAALADSETPWQIVVFHIPAYSGGIHGGDTVMRWPFAEWGADFVISGHNHIYERILQDGIRYFTAGTAAQDVRTGSQIGEAYYSGSGAMRVNASDTSITLEYVSSDGVIRDTYTETSQASDDPTITTSTSSLSTFASEPGVPSAEQSYTVSGSNLTGDVVVTPPNGFEISTGSDEGFDAAAINLSPTEGALPATTVYVRLNSDAAGPMSGNIRHQSDGAVTKNVAVTGTTSSSTTPWVAYNDLAWASGQTSDNITTYTLPGDGTSSGLLVDYATGQDTSVTVAITASGSPAVETGSQYGGAATAPGTDAYNTFSGKVDMAGVIRYGNSAWYVDLTFSGLDPNGSYTFATSANRDGSSYTRNSRFTISGSDAVISASTSGVDVIDNESVYFNTGYNTENGYVARWSGINPGSDGSFSVRVEANSGTEAYGPSVFMLGLEGELVTHDLTVGDDGNGSVSLSPDGGVYAAGTTVTLIPLANPGYAFSHWSGPDAGDVVLSGATYTIVMDDDKEVTASFDVSLCSDVSLTASADTWLRSSSPQQNYGGATELQVGTNSSYPQNMLLRWDVSGIPADATVTAASLTFQVNEGTSNAIRLYNMRQAWVEGTSTGADSSTSANWNTYNGSSNWGSGGAQSTTSDRYDVNLWDAAASAFAATGSQTIDLNPSGIAVVQGWADGSLDNYGLTVQRETGTSSQYYWKVASREAPNEAQHPRLNVTYCLPTSDPTITTSVDSLPSFGSQPGVPSSEQSYTVSAVNLTEDLVITAPADFEVSTTSGSGSGSTVNLTPVDGTIAATTIYVRFSRPTEGSSAGVIGHESAGASARTVAVSGTAALTPPWTAYNDVSGSSTPPNTTEFTIDTTNGVLLDFDTGEETGATVTVSTSGSLTNNTTMGAATDAGTDAYDTFNGRVNMAGVVQYNVSSAVDWWMDLTFTGLDPNKTYTFATSVNRNDASYTDRITRYTISNVDGATNASTPGTSMHEGNPLAVYFCTGANTANGYVARWVNIQTGTDGSFTVRAQPHSSSQLKAYAYGAFMLAEEPTVTYTLTAGDDGNGTVNLDPAGGVYAPGTDVTLTPVPNPGYQFDAWTGSDVANLMDNGDGTWTITMDGPKSVTANFGALPPTCYALTLSHDGQGSDPVANPASSDGCEPGEYVAGEVIALSGATPATGWEIAGWTGTDDDGSTAATNGLTMPAADHAAGVTYVESAPVCHALTLGHTGQGGDPVANPASSDGCEPGEYVVGEIIDLSGATPDSGWEIGGWTGTGDDGSTAATNGLTMPAADHAAGVTYVESAPVCYALTLSHDGQGSDPVATPTNSTACEEGEYLVGESIALTAAPAGGWHIGGWSGTDNDSSTATTNGLTMPAQAHVVSVIYTDECQDLMWVVVPAHGDLVPGGTVIAEVHMTTASSILGAEFTMDWDDDVLDLVDVEAGPDFPDQYVDEDEGTVTVAVLSTGGSAGFTGSTIVANLTFEALAVDESSLELTDGLFSLYPDSYALYASPACLFDGQVTVHEPEYLLTISTVGSGSVAKAPDQATYHEGDQVELTATAEVGWSFTGWSGGLTGAANPATITIAGDTAVTATFTRDEYTLTVNTVGSGSVVKAPNQATYHYGDEVQLTATAVAGWSFAGWSGDLTGAENPATITIAGDTAVTATFTRDEYTLTVNTVGSGSVVKAPNQATYHYGDVVQLTAGPVAGWSFAGWSGDLTGAANPATVTIEGDTAVTATFTQWGIVAGIVKLQGRDYSGGAGGLENSGTTVTLQPGDHSDVTQTDGTFRIADVPAGSGYEIQASMPGYLTAIKSGISVSLGDTVNLNTVKLLGGDANRDQEIDIFDLTFVGGRFKKLAEDWESDDAHADINGDGAINILDLTLVGSNYEKNYSPWLD